MNINKACTKLYRNILRINSVIAINVKYPDSDGHQIFKVLIPSLNWYIQNVTLTFQMSMKKKIKDNWKACLSYIKKVLYMYVL